DYVGGNSILRKRRMQESSPRPELHLVARQTGFIMDTKFIDRVTLNAQHRERPRAALSGIACGESSARALEILCFIRRASAALCFPQGFGQRLHHHMLG